MPDTQPGATGAMTPVCLLGPRDGWLARRRPRPARRGRDEQFAAAAATLIGQGDHGLALEIIQPGLLRHPASITLAGLRRTALYCLLEQYQQFDPFKFLIYAELAGAEIGPVE